MASTMMHASPPLPVAGGGGEASGAHHSSPSTTHVEGNEGKHAGILVSGSFPKVAHGGFQGHTAGGAGTGGAGAVSGYIPPVQDDSAVQPGSKGGSHRKKRRRARGRGRRGGRGSKPYAEMTWQEKYQVLQAERARAAKEGAENTADAQAPTDAEGNVLEGVFLQDYRPPAPRLTTAALMQSTGAMSPEAPLHAADQALGADWSDSDSDSGHDVLGGVGDLLSAYAASEGGDSGVHPLLSMAPPSAAVYVPPSPVLTAPPAPALGAGVSTTSVLSLPPPATPHTGDTPGSTAGSASRLIGGRPRSFSCDSTGGVEPQEFAAMSRHELGRKVRALRRANAALQQRLSAAEAEVSVLRRAQTQAAASSPKAGGRKRRRDE